jgi:hypothetical protein
LREVDELHDTVGQFVDCKATLGLRSAVQKFRPVTVKDHPADEAEL